VKKKTLAKEKHTWGLPQDPEHNRFAATQAKSHSKSCSAHSPVSLRQYGLVRLALQSVPSPYSLHTHVAAPLVLLFLINIYFNLSFGY